jgi:hypothetical protein
MAVMADPDRSIRLDPHRGQIDPFVPAGPLPNSPAQLAAEAAALEAEERRRSLSGEAPPGARVRIEYREGTGPVPTQPVQFVPPTRVAIARAHGPNDRHGLRDIEQAREAMLRRTGERRP